MKIGNYAKVAYSAAFWRFKVKNLKYLKRIDKRGMMISHVGGERGRRIGLRTKY